MTGLTIEELITMGYYDNPLVVNKSQKWYKKQYKRLRAIHNFTWDGRQKLTPARKGQITKLYNQHYIALGKIERGVYSFVNATKAQSKNLDQQFPHTNKGIIYNKPIHSGEKRQTTIIGRGNKTQLMDKITIKYPTEKSMTTKFTTYLPFPDNFDPSNIDYFIDIIESKLQPDYISVAINGYAGSQSFLPSSMASYAPSLTDSISQAIDDADSEDEVLDIFTGVFIIYYRKGLTKKWLQKIKKIIDSLY
jgi:hypothetical protein